MIVAKARVFFLVLFLSHIILHLNQLTVDSPVSAESVSVSSVSVSLSPRPFL